MAPANSLFSVSKNLIEAFFTSQVHGEILVERLCLLLKKASSFTKEEPVNIHIFTFSFTNKAIADLIDLLTKQNMHITIRIIADWAQGNSTSGRQVNRLAGLNRTNLLIRYKIDQPYLWDIKRGCVRWSYHASQGMQHHKILAIHINNRPWKLACGSFNWTNKAIKGYENLQIISALDEDAIELMRRVELEFNCMWCDKEVTINATESHEYFHHILNSFRDNPQKKPENFVCSLDSLQPPDYSSVRQDEQKCINNLDHEKSIIVAFSSKKPNEVKGDNGYSEINKAQRMMLVKPLGSIKSVPVTITTVALEAIFTAKKGEIIKVAMYGISPRIPEYGALVDAAIRGVIVMILLDDKVSGKFAQDLAIAAKQKKLPIYVKTCRRTMHQKYIIHAASNTVVTGTANMSVDASRRHTENRILFRNNKALLIFFEYDFDTIWERLDEMVI
jgi:hypothetical protein